MSEGTTTPGFDLVCSADFFVVGFFYGEKAGSFIRMVSLLVTVSIVSSWVSRRNISNLTLFFAHWLSGLVNLLAQRIMSEMVSLCYASIRYLYLIKFLKFLELAASNLLALTNVAMAFNLAVIIKSHRNLSVVRSFTSLRTIVGLLVVSVLVAVAALPVWDTIIMSGTLFYPQPGRSKLKSDWLVVSSLLVELVAGAVLFVIVALVVIFRRPELIQVWGLNRRVKFYFCLTVIALTVDLAIGIGGVFTYVSQTSAAEYYSVTFSMRALHIALDTLVLYSALGETKFAIGSGVGSSTGQQGGRRGGGSLRSSLRSANQRLAGVNRGASGGPSKTDGVGGSDCERGHGVMPPTARAPSAGSSTSKLWPPAVASTAAIHHSSSSSSRSTATPVYNPRELEHIECK